jgi:CRP-like cAMP-binding protein
MSNALIRRLDAGATLLPTDRARLEVATSATIACPPRHDVTRDNDLPQHVHLVVEGFACRYKILPEGRRAILALLLPGDFCDFNAVLLGRMDHAVATITACTIAKIPFQTISELTTNHPRIARAFWWATLADAAITREWLASMGQRSAAPQLAHLICELFTRLQIIGRVDGESFSFPFTQEELGDTLGMTSVHVNRVLNQLRDEGLVSLHARVLTILDLPRLVQISGFDRSYLHSLPVRLAIPA